MNFTRKPIEIGIRTQLDKNARILIPIIQENDTLRLGCLANTSQRRNIDKYGLVKLVANRFKLCRYRVLVIKNLERLLFARVDFTSDHD